MRWRCLNLSLTPFIPGHSFSSKRILQKHIITSSADPLGIRTDIWPDRSGQMFFEAEQHTFKHFVSSTVCNKTVYRGRVCEMLLLSKEVYPVSTGGIVSISGNQTAAWIDPQEHSGQYSGSTGDTVGLRGDILCPESPLTTSVNYSCENSISVILTHWYYLPFWRTLCFLPLREKTNF